jgi:hypothetical protein
MGLSEWGEKYIEQRPQTIVATLTQIMGSDCGKTHDFPSKWMVRLSSLLRDTLQTQPRHR